MRIAWTIPVALIICLSAPAQETGGPERGRQEGFSRGPGRGRFPGPNIGFMTLDLNGDGVLDAAEIQATGTSLGKLDTNADGQISADEVRAAMPQGRGRGGPGRERGEREGGAQTNMLEETVKSLMSFDANSDGKLSLSELPERFQGIFNRGDENKDGFLTPEEIRKVASAQAAPSESAGFGRRGGPEGGPGEGRRGPRGDMNFIRIDPILAAVDSNGDGVISASEMSNSAVNIRKLDKDGDGKLTREDVMPLAGPGRPF